MGGDLLKRGTIASLTVTFKGLDADNVEKIVFLFKCENREDAPAALVKKYPDNVNVDFGDGDGVFYIPFTEPETRLFSGRFYMDTKIYYKDGTIPETNIVGLTMSPTLFDIRGDYD